jgi:hypothetical protein
VARIDSEMAVRRGARGPATHLRGRGGEAEGLRHAAQPLARLRLRGRHRLAGRFVRPQAELARRLQMSAALSVRVYHFLFLLQTFLV